ncbi:unnamed protein product [Ilex paraguariensis]|uniref:Uncharacterized protein n=1 Tax=Ilex paraguariensis TaxID=185542 RepID=A0ABC8SFY1_9AQUA
MQAHSGARLGDALQAQRQRQAIAKGTSHHRHMTRGCDASGQLGDTHGVGGDVSGCNACRGIGPSIATACAEVLGDAMDWAKLDRDEKARRKEGDVLMLLAWGAPT